MVPHVDSTMLLQGRRSKKFDDMFDRLYKEKLDLIGENELLKHKHAAPSCLKKPQHA